MTAENVRRIKRGTRFLSYILGEREDVLAFASLGVVFPLLYVPLSKHRVAHVCHHPNFFWELYVSLFPPAAVAISHCAAFTTFPVHSVSGDEIAFFFRKQRPPLAFSTQTSLHFPISHSKLRVPALCLLSPSLPVVIPTFLHPPLESLISSVCTPTCGQCASTLKNKHTFIVNSPLHQLFQLPAFPARAAWESRLHLHKATTSRSHSRPSSLSIFTLLFYFPSKDLKLDYICMYWGYCLSLPVRWQPTGGQRFLLSWTPLYVRCVE